MRSSAVWLTVLGSVVYPDVALRQGNVKAFRLLSEMAAGQEDGGSDD